MTTNIKIIEDTGYLYFFPLEILTFYKNHCFNREGTIFFIQQGGQTYRIYQPSHLLSEPQVTHTKVSKGIGPN